jgi:hypothetical protein
MAALLPDLGMLTGEVTGVRPPNRLRGTATLDTSGVAGAVELCDGPMALGSSLEYRG